MMWYTSRHNGYIWPHAYESANNTETVFNNYSQTSLACDHRCGVRLWWVEVGV